MPRSSKPRFTSFYRIFSASFVFCLLWPSVAKAQQNGMAGVPWRGEPGITESVRDIMAREYAQGPRRSQPPIIPPRGRHPGSQTGNPTPPKGGQPQAGGLADVEGGSPSALSGITVDSPAVFNAQSVGATNFLGPTLADSNYLPPDSMGAVGPSQILVVVNGRIRTYNKSGTYDGNLDVTTNTFFNSVCSCGAPSYPNAYTTDPRVVFDVLSQRWFVSMVNVPSLSIATVQNSGGLFKITTSQPHGLPLSYTGSVLISGAMGKGSITAITASGTAPSGSGTVNGISQDSTSGTGTGATFNVTRSGGVYTVTINAAGSGFAVGDTITIKGTHFPSGTSPANDITITVTTINPSGPFSALNQLWNVVTVLDSTSFTLNGSTYSSGWGSGGQVRTSNRILIAVSNSATITTVGSFTFFQFQQDVVGGLGNLDTGFFADYPTLGVDANGLYIGVNMYDLNLTHFQAASAFAIKRTDLLSGTLTVTPFRHSFGGFTGMFAPIAATNMDPNATLAYIIGWNSNSPLTTLLFRAVKFNTSDGTFSLPAGSSVAISIADSVDVLAQSSNQPLDGLGGRFLSAQLANGSLWTTVTIQVDATGAACESPCSGGRDGVRFYEINNLTGTPSVRQSGTMFDSSLTNPLSYWGGSIATSGQGHTVLASSYAGATAYAGAAYAGRLSGDTLGTLNPPTALAAGVGPYNEESGTQRWGDYSKVAVDPSDNMTMWSFVEYANATNSWGIRVSQILAPPPATPSAASPFSASAGTTTSVTITGSSTDGSGFYDPGSGFPNHISAMVNGGGVTVNSVTYTDPTHITLNVTIASTAAQSARTVTVTNPDGQSVTSATAIFTITKPAQITLSPPTGLPTGTVGVAYTQPITGSGGTPPYTYSIFAGDSLPAGLSLSFTTGVISGTPTTSGTRTFNVQATDSLGGTGSTQYTLQIANLITNNFSLSINSRSYATTTGGGYVGNYTLNTTLKNNGSAVNSAIYLQITALSKNGTDLIPSQPDKLLTAENGAGVVGDTQQIVASLGAGLTTSLNLLVGIGSRQSFNLWFDVLTVLPGAALTASEGVVFKPLAAVSALSDGSPTGAADTAVGGAPVLIGQFHLDINDAIPPAIPPDSNLTGDPLSNVGVITGAGPQSRPSAAVDPIIPKHIAIAATDYATQSVRVSTSQDGGFTWHATTLSRSVLNQNFVTAENPSVAFDSHGRLSVVYSLANPFDSANAIVISESSDGINFSPPAAITFHATSEGILDSRPVIATRANAGRYVAWDSLSLATLRYSINLVRSEEGGSFGPVRPVVSNGLVSSPALALSKNRVYIGWDDWGFNSSAPYTSGGRLMITSSSHSGQGEQEEGQGDNQRGRNKLVFGAPQEIARTSIGFAQKITAMPEKGVGPNLSLAVDPKKEDVYAVFADRGNGMDIFFARSPNGGKKWQITTVNDDKSAADQFSPAIAVDEDGRINVSFYDTRLSSTFETAHIFLARSSDGKSFDNKRITNASSNDSRSNPLRDYTANLGDQTAVAITDGDAIVAWTDTRLDSEDIFTSIVFDPFGAFVTGSGKIVSAAGAYTANPTLAGTAEFGFDFEYKKNSSVPAGETEFKFTPAKAKGKFGFQSTSYDSLVITGAMAQFKGSGKVNGGGNYAFLVTITDGNQPGAGGRDKFRIKIVDNATGAVVYDNVPGAPDQINIASPEAITEGKIKIVN